MTITQLWIAVMTGQVQREMHIPIANTVRAIMAVPEEQRAVVMMEEIVEHPELANEIAIMFVAAFKQLQALASGDEN